MTYVIKNSGTKERFDIGKARNSIRKAAVDASISAGKVRGLIERVTGNVCKMAKSKTVVTTREIRDMILNDSDKISRLFSKAWRRFEKKYKE